MSAKPHHERIDDPELRRAVDLLDEGDAEGLRAHLRRHPDLVRRRARFEGETYFREPTLLEFVAENPVRRDRLPPNIVEVARVILDAGARADRRAVDETLGLVASGRVPREHGVQGALIDLLCDAGGDPGQALPSALTHGEWAAAEALIRRGARVTLEVAAARGTEDEVLRLLPAARPEERHRALAWAAQHGHAGIVALLLDAGEDPNRWNPEGAHAHSMPLHQAALAGHLETAKLLVARGARTEVRDTLHQGTPLDWAAYAGQDEVAAFLRSVAAGES